MMAHFLLVGENILINTEGSSLMQHWFIFLLVLDKDIHQLILVHHLYCAGVHYVAIIQGSGTEKKSSPGREVLMEERKVSSLKTPSVMKTRD